MGGGGGRARVVEVCLAALLFLIPLGTLVPGNGPAPAAAPAPRAASGAPVAVLGSCSGFPLSSHLSGSLEIEGGTAPASVLGGENVTLGYAYQSIYTPQNRSSIVSCLGQNATVTTDSQGNFSATVSLPSSFCTRYSCTNYSGPYGPWRVVRPPAPPTGYFLSTRVETSRIALAFVADLARADLVANGSGSVSVNASTSVRIVPLAGDGSPAQGALLYGWALSGSNWSVENASGGILQLRAGSEDSANLSAWVNGTDGGVSYRVGPVTAELTAVRTLVVTANTNVTATDPGGSVYASVVATGAAGYRYAARFVVPGENASMVSCQNVSTVGSLVYVRCGAVLVMNAVGPIRPSVTVSNGFSQASRSFPTVKVDPHLTLQVTPAAPVGYIGLPLTVNIVPFPGTGTAPYGQTCLQPPQGRVQCRSTPGSFSLATGGPVNGTATAWVQDAVGAIAWTNFSVVVVPPLGLASLVAPPGAAVGVATDLSAPVSGGLLPIHYWWNESPSLPLTSGWLSASRVAELTFWPTRAGPETLELTVADAAGSVRSISVSFPVGVGPATRIVSAPSENFALVAGDAIAVSWRAVDAGAETVADFSAPVGLVVNGPGAGALGVEATSPVLPLAPGMFVLAASCWTQGTLTVRLASTVSGLMQLRLEAPLPVSPATGGVNWVTVTPDLSHLVLSHPQTHWTTAGANDTRWDVTDRFGNPLSGGFLQIDTLRGDLLTTEESPILPYGMASFVWVNLSAPAAQAVRVVVFSSRGEPLLPLLTVPAYAPSLSALQMVELAAGSTAASAVTVTLLIRRARPRGTEAGRDDEEELRRLAEARDALLDAVADTPVGLVALLDRIAPQVYSRAELAEQLTGLVAEGAIAESTGPEGEPLFSRTTPKVPRTPRVELDSELLEASLARREAPGETPESDGVLEGD